MILCLSSFVLFILAIISVHYPPTHCDCFSSRAFFSVHVCILLYIRTCHWATVGHPQLSSVFKKSCGYLCNIPMRWVIFCMHWRCRILDDYVHHCIFCTLVAMMLTLWCGVLAWDFVMAAVWILQMVFIQSAWMYSMQKSEYSDHSLAVVPCT